MDTSITIYDIAKACHVSIATVSRVLNENPNVSEKTKEKVLAKMKELQYNPNPFARGIGLHTMKLIGVVCRDVTTYTASLALSRLTKRFQDAGYVIALTCSQDADEEDILNQYQQRHVDGLVLVGTPFHEKDSYTRLASMGEDIPIFTVAGNLPEGIGYTITSAWTISIRQILEKFAKQGLGVPLLLWDDILPLKSPEQAAYRQIYKDIYGTSATKSVIPMPLAAADQEQVLLKHLAIQGVEALIATTDRLALMAWDLLQQYGLERTLVSCVDTPAMAAAGITSLDTSLASQCDTAARELLLLLGKDDTAVPVRTEFKGTWHFRPSFPEDA